MSRRRLCGARRRGRSGSIGSPGGLRQTATQPTLCILIIYYFINLHACGGTLRLRRLWLSAPTCGRVAAFNCQVEPQTAIAADDANNVRRFLYTTCKPVD